MLGKNIKSRVKFFKDKIDRVERPDENDMKTLIMVIKSLNEKDERPAT